MKVLALRADEGACAFYRVTEPARVVNEQFAGEVEVEVAAELDVEAHASRDTLTVSRVNTDADIVVFQRPLLSSLLPAMQQLQNQGVKVIVEVDDDFEAVHPKSVAWEPVQPKYSPYSNWKHLASAARIADWVTVSTPALARRYGGHGRVSIRPNFVPESIFDVRPQATDNAPRIGWTGTVQTHPSDLQVTSGAIGEVVRDTSSRFTVVGDSRRVQDLLRLPEAPHETGWVPLKDYYQTIADGIDVGVVPLEQSRFNEAKSNLKGLEFASLGVPFVASPTEEYKALASSGAGLLARRPYDWIRHLTRLTTNADYRLEAIESGLRAVRPYTYENHAYLWVAAWKSALGCTT